MLARDDYALALEITNLGLKEKSAAELATVHDRVPFSLTLSCLTVLLLFFEMFTIRIMLVTDVPQRMAAIGVQIANSKNSLLLQRPHHISSRDDVW
jgi:hypothetical protein